MATTQKPKEPAKPEEADQTKAQELEKPPVSDEKPEHKDDEFTLVAVYGLMVDPHTGEHYTEKPRKVRNIPHWVASQIKAGKILRT